MKNDQGGFGLLFLWGCTMNAIVPFSFEGAPVRVETDANGEPLFVARDVVEAVEATWVGPQSIAHVPEIWKGHSQIMTPGGRQRMVTLTEPGVFFYLNRSDKPKALPIQMWIAGEVLPSIRRTGGYGAPADPMTMLNDPAALRTVLLGYTEKVLALETKVEEMTPDVNAYKRIAASDGSLCITDAAKTLQLKPKDLFKYLRENGWIYSRAGSNQEIAYQAKIVIGLLEHKTHTIVREDGSEKTRTQVRVTPKGLARLAKEPPLQALLSVGM